VAHDRLAARRQVDLIARVQEVAAQQLGGHGPAESPRGHGARKSPDRPIRGPRGVGRSIDARPTPGQPIVGGGYRGPSLGHSAG
jgi:hypothetical protein